MTSGFSRIAIGAALACACQLASAQFFGGSVTVTQQGVGNTSAAEQTLNTDFFISTATAAIAQTGNNNHVGGPGSSTSGLLQLNNRGGMEAQIVQNGSGNNASVTKIDNFSPIYPVIGQITQFGKDNTATLRQHTSDDIRALLEQTGAANVAHVEQDAGTASLRTTQHGVGNRVTVTVEGGGIFGGPGVIQNGEGNVATVIGQGSGASGPGIQQTGSFNLATAVQTGVFDSPASIRQQGIGNTADTSQTGDGHRIDIDQNGNGNLASVSQTSALYDPPGSIALIAQLGNSNTAIVRQVGQHWVANVNQTGSGNYTNIYQH